MSQPNATHATDGDGGRTNPARRRRDAPACTPRPLRVGGQQLANEVAVYKDFLQTARGAAMRQPRVEGRVSCDELARVRAFSSAWRAFHGGSNADAFRALICRGLDAAARSSADDERWYDLEDRVERIEALLDALGRAVSATPALAAWLLANAPSTDASAPSAEELAEGLEELLAADWNERRHRLGLPRPRPRSPRPARPALDIPPAPSKAASRTRLRAVTVRLAPRDFERTAAYAMRGARNRQAALVDLVRRGLDASECETRRDDLARLLDRAERIERLLDVIGPLATSPAAVVVHLWRHLTGRPEEWERVLLHEVAVVAEATWHALQEGLPQAAPGRLALDPIDETEGDGWPT